MGMDDKAKNQGQNLTGKAKEAVGRASGDKPLENQGRRDQKKSHLKQAGESLKKVFKR